MKLQNQYGKQIPFDDLIKDEFTLIEFVGNFGTFFCVDKIMKLRDSYNKISKKGLAIVVIVPATLDQIDDFIETYGPFPFLIYGDPEHRIYKKLGHVYLTKIKFWTKLITNLLSYAIKGNLIDKLPKTPQQKIIFTRAIDTKNIYVQGSTWLFSNDKEIIWSHIENSPDDYATMDEIFYRIETNF
jgi:peroxiredoxin